jgi:hypothetical protein
MLRNADAPFMLQEKGALEIRGLVARITTRITMTTATSITAA